MTNAVHICTKDIVLIVITIVIAILIATLVAKIVQIAWVRSIAIVIEIVIVVKRTWKTNNMRTYT